MESILRFVCVFIGVLIPACVLSQNSLTATQTLVVATYQYADNDRIKNIEPFAQHLSNETGIQTQVKSYPSVQALLHAMNRQEVDLVFMNTFGYLMLREFSTDYEISAAFSIPPNEESNYKAILAVGRNVPVKTLDDVVSNAAEFVLTLVSTGSTSGNLIPRLLLASKQPGIPERFFLEVMYTNSHRKSIDYALAGDYSLCAFGSTEYYGLGADTVKLKKLWESPPIPLGPVVLRKAISSSIKGQVQQSLLNLHTTSPEVLNHLKAGWTEFKPADRFQIVTDVYYDELWKLSGNKDVALLIIKQFNK
jgi:phosphonate transport system substrate-binding protein